MGAKKIVETMNEAELVGEISRVVMDITGVQLGQKQYALVQGRISKRMRDLKIDDHLEYSRYYNANEAVEVGILISLLTTHHTFFFREFQHFEYLLKVSLPLVIKSHREKGEKVVRIWSAACSRGQEVYSLAMFMKYHLSQLAPEMTYEIIGSDVDGESVTIAKNGVYTWDELRVVPSVYLQGGWSKGSGDIAQYVRAKDEIRKGTSFRTVNLMELANHPPFPVGSPKFDFIFCRNVFIYFTHQQIKQITSELLKQLSPEGHLFVGLSESLNGLELPIEWVGPSVYEQKRHVAKPAAALKAVPARTPAPAAARAPATHASGPPPKVQVYAAPQVLASRRIRVLCVDDSPTVLLLLKRILTQDKGFELVGTAGDGHEAAEKARALKPDIITLDIHMPKMTGVEFLEKHFKELHIPVVVVSSVPREDGALAFRCLELGASDYIEKPSAANLDKVEEELHFKLRVAEESWRQANSGPTRSRAFELDASFQRPPQISDPHGKMRVILCNFASRDVMQVLIKNFRGTQPGTLVIVDGAGELYADFVKKVVPQISGARAGEIQALKDVGPNAISFLELAKGASLIKRDGGNFAISALVVGPMNRSLVQVVSELSLNHLMIEDRGSENPASLIKRANLVVPLTSFVYESDRFLASAQVPGAKGTKR